MFGWICTGRSRLPASATARCPQSARARGVPPRDDRDRGDGSRLGAAARHRQDRARRTRADRAVRGRDRLHPRTVLDFHPNGMTITAPAPDDRRARQTYSPSAADSSSPRPRRPAEPRHPPEGRSRRPKSYSTGCEHGCRSVSSCSASIEAESRIEECERPAAYPGRDGRVRKAWSLPDGLLPGALQLRRRAGGLVSSVWYQEDPAAGRAAIARTG